MTTKPSLTDVMLALAGTSDGPDPDWDAFDRALASFRGASGETNIAVSFPAADTDRALSLGTLMVWANNLGYTDDLGAAIQTALAHVVLGAPLLQAGGEPVPNSPELTDEQFEHIKAVAAEQLKDFVPIPGRRTSLFPELQEDEGAPTP